jgi:hypothetical protein
MWCNTPPWEVFHVIFAGGQGEAPFAMFIQDDGNLVIRDRNNNPVWSSIEDKRRQDNVAANDIGDRLVSPIGESCLWSNKCLVSNNKRYRACQQADGNLVVYDFNTPRPTPIWANNMFSDPGSRLCIDHPNSEIKSYSGHPNFEPYWDTRNTYNLWFDKAYLVMQDDGNLVFSDGRRQFWSSKDNDNPVVLWRSENYTDDYRKVYGEADLLHNDFTWTLQEGGISAIQIPEGKKVIAYTLDDFKGEVKEFTQSVPKLRDIGYKGKNEGWNNRIRSLKVRKT